MPANREEVPSLLEDAAGSGPLPSRSRRILKLLTGFLLGQGCAQGLSVLAGLFLVHVLSIEAYAQFGVTLAFQSVFSILMDLGFASTIVPLVGDRRDDRALLGAYVRSAKHLRDRMFLFLAPLAAVAFLTVMHRRQWPLPLQLGLLVSVLVSLYAGGQVAYFSAPLLIFGRMRAFYLPQVLTAGGRLLLYVLLSLTAGLNALTAAAFAALNIVLNGAFIERASRRWLDWPARAEAHVNRELVRYILPATPAIVFSAFQMQISLFLVSFFGGTSNIAEVTALGRIGQLFLVMMTFNSVIVEPYIARHSHRRLLRSFLLFIGLAIVACTPLVLLAFFVPQAYLWILGAKYVGVKPLMGWYILSASMNFVSGLVWIMNRARKWVFWSGSALEVGLVLLVQIVFLSLVGVRTTANAVFFGLAASGCYAVAHGYVTITGFAHDRRHRLLAAS